MMKKIWKIIFILTGILFGIGILCAAAGFLMGGSFEALMQDDLAANVINWLSPSSQILNILAFLGV